MTVIRIKTKDDFLTNWAKVFPFCHVSTLHVFHYIALAAGIVALTTQPFASSKWTNLGLNFRICTDNNLLTFMKLCDMIFKGPSVFKDLVALGPGTGIL